MSAHLKSSMISIAFVAISAILFTLSDAIGYSQTMSVSVPALRLASKERIGGFEFRITSGRIASVPKVPIGWDISVNNDPSWNTVIKGSIVVGAAAVDSNFFRDFLVVDKRDSLGPFNIEGEVVVSADFTTERRIKLEMKDLRLQLALPNKSHSVTK